MRLWSQSLPVSRLLRPFELVRERALSWLHRKKSHLSGPRHSQRGNHGVGAVAAIGCQHAFHERGNVCEVKDIELRGILFKNPRESEFLDGASTVTGGVESNVRRTWPASGVLLARFRLFDRENAIRWWRARRRRSQAQEDLEEIMGGFGLHRVHRRFGEVGETEKSRVSRHLMKQQDSVSRLDFAKRSLFIS